MMLYLFFGLLLLASAFFSGAETAIFSLSRIQIHRFRSSTGSAARNIVKCLRAPRTTLVTILLGNELANISLSIIGAALVSRFFPVSVEEQMLIAIAIVTPLVLIFGEIVPKNIALRFAKQLAPLIAYPLRIFYLVVTPFRIILSSIADGMVRLFGGKPEVSEPMIMEQEFRRLVDLGRAEGVIVEEERELIHNIFEFTDKVVRDIMTPTADLFLLSADVEYEEMLAKIRENTYSRIPVYEGDRHHVIGILHLRDLFAFDRKQKSGEHGDLKTILHAPLFVEPGEKIETLLRKFQEGHVHLALALEQGKLVGLVTMDDVLRELFGGMID